MPLDPEIAELLAATDALGLPPYQEIGAERARTTYEELVRHRRRGATPVPVRDVGEAVAEHRGHRVPVRIYQPQGAEPRAVLVFLHGGGWTVGSVETHDHQARVLCAATGAQVVSVDYRLAPEHPYPAALDDAWAATCWAVDDRPLAVGGDSAGGNLAAAVCLRARDEGGPALVAQCLIYPALDLTLGQPSITELAEGYGLTAAMMSWYVEQYVGDAVDRTDPLASPLHAPDLRGLPPAVVVTAEYDPLRDEGEAYAERLRAARVPVTLRRYEGLVHGFLGMGPAAASARRAVDEVCADLRRALGSRRETDGTDGRDRGSAVTGRSAAG
jgi:acetyl esterase